MFNKRLLIGLSLLGAGLLYADVPHQNVTLGRALDAQGLDQPIGKVWFMLKKSSGQKALITPLMPVDLDVTRVRDEDNPPNGLLKCLVVRRALIFSESTSTVVNLTVLKCPNNREYVTDQVLFVLEGQPVQVPTAIKQ